jgi:hypothetical protein
MDGDVDEHRTSNMRACLVARWHDDERSCGTQVPTRSGDPLRKLATSRSRRAARSKETTQTLKDEASVSKSYADLPLGDDRDQYARHAGRIGKTFGASHNVLPIWKKRLDAKTS